MDYPGLPQGGPGPRSENTMAQTISSKEPATAQYTVLRPICMGGERVEPGDTVVLTQGQYAELKAANKVGPHVPKAPKAEPKAEAKEAKK